MADRLTGKTVLITGAARGQGAEEARLFCAEGANVMATDVLADDLGAVVHEVRAKGQSISSVALDVSSEDEWRRAVNATVKEFGRLDVLINNAGIFDIANAENTDQALWDRIIAVDLTGTWLGIKHCAPAMRDSGGGAVVNIGSVFGKVGSGTSAAYHSAKSGVRTLTKTAAVEFGPQGIRINLILPGIIDTPILEGLPQGFDEAFLARTPLGRMGSPSEIANGAVFLASDEASYITGTELIIDGGYTAT